MSFLSNMFQSRKVLHDEWQAITDMSDLDRIDILSQSQPIVLFKDSLTCGISAAARHRLHDDWSSLGSEVKFYYLDLLSHRAISNEIAARYNVVHQSPQIIIVHRGRSVYNTSHHLISITDLRAAHSRLSGD